MKQISAILIAFFLCAGATQVSAQEMLQLTEVTQDNYVATPTDINLWLIDPLPTKYAPNSKCTLGDAKNCKGRIIRLINRRNNNVIIPPHNPLDVLDKGFQLVYLQAVTMVSDGKTWRVLSKSN